MAKAKGDRETRIFDPEIMTRHLPSEFFLACLRERYRKGRTDTDLRADIPHSDASYAGKRSMEHAEAMRLRILGVLCELRDLGMLKPVPNTAGRDIRPAEEWNTFVRKGPDGMSEAGIRHLMKCPLPQAINEACFFGAWFAVKDLRVARGYADHAAYNPEEKVGPMADMPMSEEDLPGIAEAAANGAAGIATTPIWHDVGGHAIICRRTDDYLEWKEGSVLSPRLGVWRHPKNGKSHFEEIVSLEKARLFRHVEIKLPSGVLLAADWFRIPGFNEGVSDPADRGADLKSINSEEGIDERTRDHYERLGLMRIHTTNCAPSLVRDGDAVRVGRLDDGKIDGTKPEVAGRVCCDLWDVTFADREILIDILVAGGKEVAANGGLDADGSPTSGYATDRETAAALLDTYVEEHAVARLDYGPGSTLQVYMATGRGSEDFHEGFRSADLSDWPFMEDMFVLSTRQIDVDPKLLEEHDWAWPERYAVAERPEPESAPAP